ncbi:hypothetical protein BH10BAC3_BH10BAC3_03330 [soil metagenome]
MDNSTWRQKLSYFTLFIPVRIYLLLFAAGTGLAYWWINTQKPGAESAYGLVLALLVKVAAWFIISILLLSLLSVLVPFFLFWFQRQRKRISITLSNTHRERRGQSLQRMEMTVDPVWQPPFGFLYYRFLYDQNQLSPKFSLAPLKSALHLFQAKKTGWYNWPLPAIREYDVDKLVVYFEDIFQFFSFSVPVRVNQSFFTKPRTTRTEEEELTPKKTEAEIVRIEELRKVQGEFLNYKNFEDNDDVRRIVWKIYAKNKELVVRTQEIFDPFASHTYFYCSYFDSILVDETPMMQTKGLNYFKNICWSMYAQLKKQGADIRYIADQDIPSRSVGDASEQVEYSVAVSHWQHNTPLQNFVEPKNASVLCVSSLTDVVSLAELVEHTGSSMTVVYVKLTNSLKRPIINSWIGWLRWIFLQEEKDKDKTGLISWRWSKARMKIRHNEKLIAEMLKKSEAKIIWM